MYFAANIKLLRKRQKRSQEETAIGLGLKRSSLSGYENGTAEPNYSTLMKFSEHFNVTLDKLLKINLSQLSESQLSELERGFDIDLTGNRMRVLATTVDSDNEENIELVPQKAKAGYATGYSDPEFLSALPLFQLPFLDRNKKYRAFQITGDSMPPVTEGSWVTGEYIVDWTMIRSGQPYIIVTRDEGVVFKIVENRVSQRETLLLCSTNPAYEPYELSISEVLEVWLFANYISPELPEPNLSRDELIQTVLGLQREVSDIRTRIDD